MRMLNLCFGCCCCCYSTKEPDPGDKSDTKIQGDGSVRQTTVNEHMYENRDNWSNSFKRIGEDGTEYVQVNFPDTNSEPSNKTKPVVRVRSVNKDDVYALVDHSAKVPDPSNHTRTETETTP